MHSLLRKFEAAERLSPDGLRARQFAQLHRLLSHAIQHSAYYKETLAAAGFDPLKPLDEATWSRIPVMDRALAQKRAADLVCASVPPGHGRAPPTKSSGTTGHPVVVQQTIRAAQIWQAQTVRNHLWHRRDFTGVLGAIRTQATHEGDYPEGRTAKSWGPAARLFRTGPAYLLNIRSQIDEQIEWLGRRRPDYLLTYPCNLADLLRAWRFDMARIPPLKGVITITGPVWPELRAECRSLLGVSLADMYSCEELGHLALQCPEFEHHHVTAESVFLEVLDEDGRPVPPGGTGRVVATPMHNFAMPLVRYALGDEAEVGDPCACGRSLPVLRRVIGRQRNRVTLPAGRRGWPKFGETAGVGQIAPVVQFKVVQHALDDVEFVAVTHRPLTQAEEAEIVPAVQSMLGHPFAVRFTYLDEIPRGGRGKYEPFENRIAG
jgi:phenylacetate-CoA ligase